MFIFKILPSTGVYCVATPSDNGGFKHSFFDNLDLALARINSLDASGRTAYIAQATFDPKKIEEAKKHNNALPRTLTSAEYKKQKKAVRGQANTLFLKNFFLDIDCGEKWPLKNQKEAVRALNAFVTETKLPIPSVVNSGNGLYAHWPLEDSITAHQWQVVANILKMVVASYSPALGGDSSRTSDAASVLRVPGTTNRKSGKADRKVSVLRDVEFIPFMDFVRKLSAAAKRRKIDITRVSKPKQSSDVNSEFFSGLDYKNIPNDAEKIADKCAQLSLMRSTGGDISEPLWYACLGVIAHCENSDEVAHSWSKGHPNYDAAETDAKLNQWRAQDVGPTTCVNFGTTNSQGCIGCKHNGRIKSPIILGRPDPEKKEIPVEQCEPPDNFRRSKEGLFVKQEDRWIKFYDQDLYIDMLAYDESLSYETMTIVHHLPFEGQLRFTIRSSLVNDPKLLMNILSDNHVKVVGFQEKKLMAAYLEGYAAKLQRNRRMSLLLCQMGWKKSRNDEDIFVLGKKIFHRDGHVEDASLAKNVPKSAAAYKASGDLSKWSQATKFLDKPGMEPFAFALLAGGFGAPLMKFTGFDGAMVSLVGTTGAGKTLLLRWIQSVWGYHNDLMMLRDDTKNALVSRLGVYGNLPLTVDEVTNMNGMELSELAYRVTQGRDKARLTKDSQERKLMNTWNTLAVTSSNASLVDKLAGAKHDAGAEINRIFEYHVLENPEFSGQNTTNIYWLLDENYGHAGEVYAKWLIQNLDEVKEGLCKIKTYIDREANMRGDERFWGAVLSVAIYGGLVAKKLGLIQFDVRRVLAWAITTVIGMRGNKKELTGDAVDILGQFIDDYAASRLLVKGAGRGAGKCVIIEEPRGPLVMRYELDNARLFISRDRLKDWLGKRFGNFTQIKNELKELGVLVDPNRRKVLGGGTNYGGAQQACWEIDMSNERLGRTVADMDKLVEAYEKNKECEV